MYDYFDNDLTRFIHCIKVKVGPPQRPPFCEPTVRLRRQKQPIVRLRWQTQPIVHSLVHHSGPSAATTAPSVT